MIKFIIGMITGVVIMAIISADVYRKGWNDCEKTAKKSETKCARCGCVIKEPKYGMKHLSLLSDTVEEEDIDLCEDCFNKIFGRGKEDE